MAYKAGSERKVVQHPLSCFLFVRRVHGAHLEGKIKCWKNRNRLFCSIIALLIMQEPLYYIEAEHISTQDFLSCRLVIFVNASFIGYLILNTENMQLLCLKFFQAADKNGVLQEDLIREVFFEDGLFAKEMKEVVLVYDFPESELIPEICFDESLIKDYVELIHGNLNKGTFCSEKVPWWDVYNVYRLPTDIRRLLQYKFPHANIQQMPNYII